MSRDWNEHKYNSSENLWSWIDEQSGRNDRRLEVAKDCDAKDYKNVLMGRFEMLESLADWITENETTLGEIAERWGLKQKEED